VAEAPMDVATGCAKSLVAPVIPSLPMDLWWRGLCHLRQSYPSPGPSSAASSGRHCGALGVKGESPMDQPVG